MISVKYVHERLHFNFYANGQRCDKIFVVIYLAQIHDNDGVTEGIRQMHR
jgi:hypothetical protein